MAECPGGIPEVLYHLPNSCGIYIKCVCITIVKIACFTGSHDYLCDVDENLLGHAEQEYGYFNDFIVDDNYKQYAETLSEEVGLHNRPINHEDALFFICY